MLSCFPLKQATKEHMLFPSFTYK